MVIALIVFTNFSSFQVVEHDHSVERLNRVMRKLEQAGAHYEQLAIFMSSKGLQMYSVSEVHGEAKRSLDWVISIKRQRESKNDFEILQGDLNSGSNSNWDYVKKTISLRFQDYFPKYTEIEVHKLPSMATTDVYIALLNGNDLAPAVFRFNPDMSLKSSRVLCKVMNRSTIYEKVIEFANRN